MQAVQLRSVVASPLLTTDWPATQFVRVAHAVAGLPSSSQVLPTQATAAVEPPAQYSPALQLSHTGAVVLVPGALCSVPAAQDPCAWHMVWFGAVEYVPLAHAVHAWSLVAVPAVLTYVPATHSLHVAHVAAFVVVL